MGRNSVDATKACLIRAVLAALATLLSRRTTGLRLLDRLTFFFVLLALVLLVLVLLDLVLLVFVLLDVVLLDVALLDALLPDRAAVDEEGCAAGLPKGCPSTGNTTISTESRPATHCETGRERPAGESANLISSL